jgi:hypothetical protein
VFKKTLRKEDNGGATERMGNNYELQGSRDLSKFTTYNFEKNTSRESTGERDD